MHGRESYHTHIEDAEAVEMVFKKLTSRDSNVGIVAAKLASIADRREIKAFGTFEILATDINFYLVTGFGPNLLHHISTEKMSTP